MSQQPTREAFLPCPFCGKDKAKLVGYADMVDPLHMCNPPHEPDTVVVVCSALGFDGDPRRGCGAATPCCESEDEAIAAWNRRAELRAVPVGIPEEVWRWFEAMSAYKVAGESTERLTKACDAASAMYEALARLKEKGT